MADTSNPINFCLRCGETLQAGIAFCPKCGYPIPGSGAVAQQAYPQQPYAQPYNAQPPVPTKRPLYAGILLILSGLVAFAVATTVFTMSDSIIQSITDQLGQSVPGVQNIINVMIAIGILIGSMAIIGGYCALKRKWYLLAVIGGVFGLFTLGVFFVEGSIMGLIGLILILMSRNEFH